MMNINQTAWRGNLPFCTRKDTALSKLGNYVKFTQNLVMCDIHKELKLGSTSKVLV
jgi:hypothetical protein